MHILYNVPNNFIVQLSFGLYHAGSDSFIVNMYCLSRPCRARVFFSSFFTTICSVHYCNYFTIYYIFLKMHAVLIAIDIQIFSDKLFKLLTMTVYVVNTLLLR